MPKRPSARFCEDEYLSFVFMLQYFIKKVYRISTLIDKKSKFQVPSQDNYLTSMAEKSWDQRA